MKIARIAKSSVGSENTASMSKSGALTSTAAALAAAADGGGKPDDGEDDEEDDEDDEGAEVEEEDEDASLEKGWLWTVVATAPSGRFSSFCEPFVCGSMSMDEAEEGEEDEEESGSAEELEDEEEDGCAGLSGLVVCLARLPLRCKCPKHTSQ